jgi:hypothetical protein
MRKFAILIILICLCVISGCGSDGNKADEVCHYESGNMPIPEGIEIETDSMGRRRWKHGDHYHYIDGIDPFEGDLKLDEAESVVAYCKHHNIPTQCVTRQLNIDENLLELEADELARILGCDVFDIEQTLNMCKE